MPKLSEGRGFRFCLAEQFGGHDARLKVRRDAKRRDLLFGVQHCPAPAAFGPVPPEKMACGLRYPQSSTGTLELDVGAACSCRTDSSRLFQNPVGGKLPP
jgi:hypothetical protein